MSSLCDKCFVPGNCCKKMYLFGTESKMPLTLWLDEPLNEQLRTYIRFDDMSTFIVADLLEEYVDEDSRRKYGRFNYNCTALQADGRCGIYETRPQLCRDYQPRSDELCVHFNAAESGDPTIGIASHD